MYYSEMEWSVNLGNVTSGPMRILTADHTESAETFSQLSTIRHAEASCKGGSTINFPATSFDLRISPDRSEPKSAQAPSH